MLAVTSLSFAGMQAMGGSVQPPPTERHQMMLETTDCMRRRMSADKVVSYNEAAKTCREQIRKQHAQPAPLVAAGNPRRP
jgi:hypothetical protein